MKNDAGVNDQQYWDRRFREDWESFEGPEQSRFFATLAVENLPKWLLDLVRRGALSLADWGCAQGDGTDLLASCLPTSTITGVDFSPTAIEQAQARYAGLRFISEDWLAESGSGEQFDVVFSSNTLEHFHRPLDVLERIARHARCAVVLALPYRELDRHQEHFFSFLPQNIPVILGNGFQLAWSRVVDCRGLPQTRWPGEQIFLVYADAQWLRAQGSLTLEDIRVEVDPDDAAQLERMARHELALARADIGAMRQSLEARAVEVASARALLEGREQELARATEALAERRTHAESLAEALQQREAQAAALSGQLEGRTGELARASADLAVQRERADALAVALQRSETELEALRGQRQEVERLTGELADARARLEQATQALQQREAEVAALRTDLLEQRSRSGRLALEAKARAEEQARLACDLELKTANEELEERKRFAESLVDMLRQREIEGAAVRTELEEVRIRAARLEVDADAREQELMRLSAWASSIAAHPGTYAVKRNAYLLLRTLYRLFPLDSNAKLKLRDFARRIRHRGVPVAQPAPVETIVEAPLPQPLPLRRQIVPRDGERDVLVFAVIDWHFRIQRPQHLARGLAQAGRRVFYVSNAFVDSDEPGYALERIDPALDLFQVKLHVKGAPQIYFAPATPATVQMLQASLARLLADFGALSTISILQHSFWFPLATSVPNSLWLYDCMDHHEGFGNVPEELVRAEQEMLRRSDLVVVTSSWLEQFASSYNDSVAVVRNAVEYEFFATPPQETFRDPRGRRIIGYFGAIAEWFDVALVRRMAQAHPDCLVLLVGNDTVNAGRQLADLKNVQFTGEVKYTELPYYLYAFDVCLLPFQVTQLTLATNPVKVYEYLAAGKPVVCVDLPEVAQFGDFVYKGANHEAFVAQVGAALAEKPEPARIAGRRAFAAAQTWQHRSQELRDAIANLRLPKVSVIVLTYNNLDLTKACLASLLAESDYPNLEIVLVDNASTDGSPEWLTAFAAEHPGVKLILNQDNLGFAAGNNVGLAAATGDYLVILNNDTVVTRGWVLTLMRHLQRDLEIGIVGPVTNNIGNGARLPTSYTELADMPSEAFSLTLAQMGKDFPLRTAAFFCVMFPRAVYDACGPMCEEYGRGFFEDDDYCRRVEAQGLKVMCAEDVFVHHHLSASFKKVPSAERQALFDHNKLRYEAKWGRWEPHTYSRAFQQPEVDLPRRLAAVPERWPGRRFIVGHCSVCGHDSRFFYTRRSLWRESLACEHCLATSKYRSLARGILDAIRDTAGVAGDALATLPKAGVERRLAVCDLQPPFYRETQAYPLPDLLRRTGWIDVAGPEASPGALGRDLRRLAHESGSLDIFVTSDLMDGVRLDEEAHREIHRVLRSGGVYVFTVAHDMARPESLVRVRVADPQDPSADEMLLEPEYHEDTLGGSDGVLSYRIYGRDLCTFLEGLGFEVRYTREDRPAEAVLGTELFYCRKT